MKKESNIANHYSKELLLSSYELMLLIRRFEERSAVAYGMGLIAGFCHLYIGQEAVVVGVKQSNKRRRRFDYILSRSWSCACLW